MRNDCKEIKRIQTVILNTYILSFFLTQELTKKEKSQLCIEPTYFLFSFQ